MSIQEEIRKRKEEIQLLIAAGNVEKALKRSMDFVSDFATGKSLMYKLIELNRALTMLKLEKEENNINRELFKQKRNFIVLELLQVIDDIEACQF